MPPKESPSPESLLYLLMPFESPISTKKLEDALECVPSALNHPKIVTKIVGSMVERYHQLQSISLEEHLMIRFIKELQSCLQKALEQNTLNISKEIFIVTIWTSINFAKKLEKNQKELLCNILELVSVSVEGILRFENGENVYPQISAFVMQYIVQMHLGNHRIFALCLSILGTLLQNVFKNRKPNALQMLGNIESSLESKNSTSTFESECLSRLEQFLNLLCIRAPTLELIYKQEIENFVSMIWDFAEKYTKILEPTLMLLVSTTNKPLPNLTPMALSLLHSKVERSFLSFPQQKDISSLTCLSTLSTLSPHLYPSPTSIPSLLHLLLKIFSLSKPSTLVSENPLNSALELKSLEFSDNFSNYPISLHTLKENVEKEIDKIIISKITIVEQSNTQLKLLRNVAAFFPNSTKIMIIEGILTELQNPEIQYSISMNHTSFLQLLTRLLLLHLLLKGTPENKKNEKNTTIQSNVFENRKEIALNLFEAISNNQGLRILQPTLPEEFLFIVLCWEILSQCRLALLTENTLENQLPNGKKMTRISKLSLTLTLLSLLLSNLSLENSLTKTTSIEILLSLSAPKTLHEFVGPLSASIVNQNFNNGEIILNLLKVIKMEGREAEALAEQFVNSRNPYKNNIIRNLFPRLSTQMMRKCILGCTGFDFLKLLKGNLHLLYKKTIEKSESTEKVYENFYMNDGENVTIANALGVVVLELGNKWEYALDVNCQYKELAIETINEMAEIDTKLVFFKARFVSILSCLTKILQEEITNKRGDRLVTKTYTLLSHLSEENFKIYFKKCYETSYSPSSVPSENPWPIFHELLVKKNKEIKQKYFHNFTNKELSKLCDFGENILNVVEKVEENSQKENKITEINDKEGEQFKEKL